MKPPSLRKKIEALQQQLSHLGRPLEHLSPSDQEGLIELVNQLTSALRDIEMPDSEVAKFGRGLGETPNLSDLSQSPSERILDGHVVTDSNNVIHLGDHAAAQLLNIKQEELIGTSLAQFFTPADAQTVQEHLKALVRGGAAQEWEMTLCPRERPSVSARFMVSALCDPRGQIVWVHWLIQDLRERERGVVANELLQHIGEHLLGGMTVSQVLPLICDRLVEMFGYPLVWIGLLDSSGSIAVRAYAGSQVHFLEGLESRWSHAAGRSSPVVQALDTRTTQLIRVDDPTWAVWAERVKKFGIQTGLILPLHSRQENLGVLSVYATRVNAFDPGIIRWFETLASQLTLSLLMAKDQEDLRLRGAAIASAEHAVFITDPAGRIEWVNDAYTRLTGYPAAEIIGTIPPFLKSGKLRGLVKPSRRAGPSTQFWKNELVVHRKDRTLYTVEQVVTPLRNDEGQVTHFVAVHQDITLRKETEARIFHLAHHDSLTDLPNRVLFQDRLTQAVAQARRHKRLLAVVFLDLDRFKTINDSLGHEIGDELLKSVAKMLTKCVRSTDTVARLSGDEFTLILQDLDRGQDAGRVAQKILETIAQPIRLANRDVLTTASVGIALYPFDAAELDGLITQADRAMYRAKEKGGDCYQYVSDDMNAQAFERQMLERSMRDAWNRGEFLLHYQPEVDLQTGQIFSIEALVRWHHADLGLVFPSQFIPMAQEIHLLDAIQEWVLQTACQQSQRWHGEGLPGSPIAVNYLVGEGESRQFLGMVKQTMKKIGFNPKNLRIEIPQANLLQVPQRVASVVQELQGLGVQLIIDDFIPTPAMFQYLEQLPLRALKLSRSLIFHLPDDPDSIAQVRESVALGRKFQLEVIAKGVESSHQVSCLRELGCHLIQGYLCDRPLPLDEMTVLLRGWWASEF